MSSLTIEEARSHRRRRGVGARPRRLCCTTALAGGGAWTRSRRTASSSFRELHIDDETQVAFSKRLDDVGKAEPAAAPTIYTVTLDPAKTRTADYMLGTFNWHIDGAQDDVPTKATVLSATVIASRGGETEFASTYAAYDDLRDEEKERWAGLRVLHSFEASQRLVHPDPSPEELARWRERPDKEHPLVLAPPLRAPLSASSAPRRDHVVGHGPRRGPGPARRPAGPRHGPERVYRHEWSVGDLVIWDNTGVMHRASPYDPSSAREMHRTTMSGDEPIR